MDENMFFHTDPDRLDEEKIQEACPDLIKQQKILNQKKYRHERLHQFLYGMISTLGLLLAAAEVVVLSVNLLPVESLISVGSLGISFMCFSRIIIEKVNQAFWEQVINQDLQLYMQVNNAMSELERKETHGKNIQSVNQ